jgi:hypothetical protein
MAGVALLALGLASAPWQVLLLILLAVLLIPQWLLRQNQKVLQGMPIEMPIADAPGTALTPHVAQTPVSSDNQSGHTTESSAPPPDTLVYRGATYSNTTPAPVENKSGKYNGNEISGKYRGCTWTVSHPPTPPATPPTVEMKYRGARITPPTDSLPGVDHQAEGK